MNKSSVPAMAAVCGVMLFAGTASADFVMLTVELFADNWKPNFPPGLHIRDVWRVYAHFNDPNDRMTAIGAVLDGTPMTVENVLADGGTPGTGLYEAFFGGAGDGGGPIADNAPGWLLNPTGLTHDTYMTIGAEAGYTPVIDPKTGDPFFSAGVWAVSRTGARAPAGSLIMRRS